MCCKFWHMVCMCFVNNSYKGLICNSWRWIKPQYDSKSTTLTDHTIVFTTLEKLHFQWILLLVHTNDDQNICIKVRGVSTVWGTFRKWIYQWICLSEWEKFLCLQPEGHLYLLHVTATTGCIDDDKRFVAYNWLNSKYVQNGLKIYCKWSQIGAQVFLVCLFLFSTCFGWLQAHHQEK